MFVFLLQYASSVTLKECLELFTQEEILDGDEMPVSVYGIGCSY